jgi:hypothetical protein
MNTTSESGFAASSNRSRAIRKVALPVPVAAGSIVVALGTGVPSVLGGVADNHNEALLAPTVDAVPPERANRRWRRPAASALVVSASLALGAVAFGFGSSPGAVARVGGKMHYDDINMGIITDR